MLGSNCCIEEIANTCDVYVSGVGHRQKGRLITAGTLFGLLLNVHFCTYANRSAFLLKMWASLQCSPRSCHNDSRSGTT